MKLLFLVLSLGVILSACTVQYSNGQQNHDPSIDCTGMTGAQLHRCAAIATGFSQYSTKNYDIKCQTKGGHMALGRATHANRQIVICKPGRRSVLVSNHANTLRVKPVHTPAVIAVNPVQAIRYGEIAKPSELAAKKGLPIGGGIKQGKVIVIPNDDDWNGLVKRHPSANVPLEIKPIARGESIAKGAKRRYHNGITGHIIVGQIPTIQYSVAHRQGGCRIVVDTFGEPITLRDGEEGIHRYGFYHPINDTKYWYNWHSTRAQSIQKQIAKEKQKLEELQNKLNRNRAYQGKQCTTLAQRPIPKAPKKVPQDVINQNTRGSCVNLMGSRFGEEKVITALESAGRWDITQDYQKWALSRNKMSCAIAVTVDEFESLKCRGLDWIAPNLAKDYFNRCLRTDIQTCISDVEEKCDEYGDWLRLRQKIVSEPKRLKASCDSDKVALDQFDYSAYNSHTQKLEESMKKKALFEDKQKNFNESTFIPFSDKRTYCTL